MSKYISSSWNPDRMAGSLINKAHKERVARPASTLNTYRTSELYTELYGREAYEAWNACEEEIREMMHDLDHHTMEEIIALREENLRQLKENGEKREKHIALVGSFNSKLKLVA